MSKQKLNLEFWSKKKVLITGHTGFKGSWLTLLLKRLGADVYGISLSTHKYRNRQSIYEAHKKSGEGNLKGEVLENLNNKNMVEPFVRSCRPDIVLHLAAQPLVRESYKKPLETWRHNVESTINLLEMINALKKSTQVLVITTDKVYDPQMGIIPFKESSALGGHDPYSLSKVAVEHLCKSFRNSTEYTKSGMTLCTVRSGNVIGGNDWAIDRLIPDFFECYIKKETMKIRNPTATRPWQHVLDCVSSYLKIIEYNSKNSNKIHNINIGPNVDGALTVEEVLDILNMNLQEKVVIEKDTNKSPIETLLLSLDNKEMRTKLNFVQKWNSVDAINKISEFYIKELSGENLVELSLKEIDSYLSA